MSQIVKRTIFITILIAGSSLFLELIHSIANAANKQSITNLFWIGTGLLTITGTIIVLVIAKVFKDRIKATGKKSEK